MMLFASTERRTCIRTFLQRVALQPRTAGGDPPLLGIGAISFGHLPTPGARRRAIITAFIAALIVIPVWAFAPNQARPVSGAFLMQFMVQGAGGRDSRHPAELCPGSVRAFLPGFTYQSAGLLASSVVFLEAVCAENQL
jgi:SHS family lactate transporter-like MFS transporter